MSIWRHLLTPESIRSELIDTENPTTGQWSLFVLVAWLVLMCSCEWNEAEVGVSSCTMNGGSDVKGKSWKKLHEERKALRKERKQERLLKNLASWERQNDSNRKEVGSTSPEQAPRKTPSTVSIAVPGSILENAQSPELRSYVAGQIARAACIFRVDEVVVFDDVGVGNVHDVQGVQAAEVERTLHSSCLQLARILQYLECPQYLRKSFFPMHNDLKYSGLLNPLDAPHHLRQQNSFQYREGVVIEKAAKAGRSYVNAGLLHDVLIDRALQPGIRVTLKLDSPDQGKYSPILLDSVMQHVVNELQAIQRNHVAPW